MIIKQITKVIWLIMIWNKTNKNKCKSKNKNKKIGVHHLEFQQMIKAIN